MRTYDNLCAITESSNLTFPMTRLAISTFVANNLWFEGTIIIITIKNNGLNQSNIDVLKSIYEKIEILEIDHTDPIMQSVSSKLLKKNIPLDRVLNYLNILTFNIKSEGNIYFSRNTVFMGDISEMLDSNHLVVPTDSNSFPNLDDFSNQPVNSKLMFVPKSLISNNNYSIILDQLKSLNISDSSSDNLLINDLINANSLNTRILSNMFMCKSSNFIDQKYSNFIRYSKSIKAIYYNTHENKKNYIRIHTYWLQQNDSIQKRLVDIKKNSKIVSIKLKNSSAATPIRDSEILNISNFKIKDSELKKNKIPNNLNIALCTICNDGFIDGARVMIGSFLRHNSWFKGKIIVYYNTIYSPLSESNMNLIRSLYLDVDFINVDHTTYDNLIRNFIKGNKSQQRLVPSLFTFEVFNDIKQFDKMLYLDSDMVVLDDISEIFGLTYDLVVTPDTGEYIDKTYGIFNGGFLFLNNSIFDKGYRDKLINHAEGMKNMFLADQTIMNSFFSSGLPMLSINYNCLKRCFSDSKYNKNVENVKIIHYVGEKPWNDKKSPREQLYTKIEKFWFDELKLINEDKFELNIVTNAADLTNIVLDGRVMTTNWGITSGLNRIDYYICSVPERELMREISLNMDRVKNWYVTDNLKNKLKLEKTFELFSYLRNISQLGSIHIHSKEIRKDLDLPTSGVQMIYLASSFNLSKLKIFGINLYTIKDKLGNYKNSGISSKENPYMMLEKPHSFITDVKFIHEAFSILLNKGVEIETDSDILDYILNHCKKGSEFSQIINNLK